MWASPSDVLVAGRIEGRFRSSLITRDGQLKENGGVKEKDFSRGMMLLLRVDRRVMVSLNRFQVVCLMRVFARAHSAIFLCYLRIVLHSVRELMNFSIRLQDIWRMNPDEPQKNSLEELRPRICWVLQCC